MDSAHFRLLVLPLCLLWVGCSEGESLPQVRGKVFIGDQPATKGSGFVTFHPDEKKGNKSLEEAVGQIQSDGSFVLDTRGTSGAAKGWYKVGVNLAEVLDPNNPYFTKWLMPDPDKYSNWLNSGISIEVVDQPVPGQYDIKLPPLGAEANSAESTK